MDRIIKHVHLQITRNCNLRCPFCGQWGKKGFFADSAGTEMELADWQRIIKELTEYRMKSKSDICVTVWGGEPLVSPYFDEIMAQLKYNGFTTEVITNGVLIDRHNDIIKTKADRLYVSIDGPRTIHDTIRGKAVFDKVKDNLLSLKHSHVIVMSVITPGLLQELPQFLDEMDTFGIKELYLQDMIGLTAAETEQYKAWMKDKFGIDAVNIDSWENNDKINYSNETDSVLNSIDTSRLSYTALHKSHRINPQIQCTSPYNHVHIAWNGNVLYCTDFYDFAAGNVHTDTVESIFLNEISESYRAEVSKNNCPTCKHCSWRITEF